MDTNNERDTPSPCPSKPSSKKAEKEEEEAEGKKAGPVCTGRTALN